MSKTEIDSSRLSDGETGIPGDRALAAWGIGSLVSSALIAEWILSAAAGRTKFIVLIPAALALALAIGSHILRGENLRDLGFRLDNFLQSLRLLAAPMIAVGILCVALELSFGTRPDPFRWHPERQLAGQLALGFLWGLVQQYALQSFINRHAQIIWHKGVRSVLVTAFIFALLHFPNPWLMVLTFIGGLVWCTVYQRVPNLFALAVSHAVMTWVLVSTLPLSALNHLRIGFNYFA